MKQPTLMRNRDVYYDISRTGSFEDCDRLAGCQLKAANARNVEFSMTACCHNGADVGRHAQTASSGAGVVLTCWSLSSS